ncbi:MAG: hypothetical protein IJ458_00620 [Clostridia bacterium]|nr:hypothetical protein [Clostridia bacterium]MBQ8522152.1 hypothetical protein [Clostridia bacterium]
MKYRNSFEGKAQLRRQEFNRSQIKSRFNGKKSLSKRIIAERVGGITKNNIDNEVERLGCMVKSDEILAQIMYHIRFAKDTRPSTFNDDVIMGILDRIKDLQVKFVSGLITAKEHVEILEEIDAQIVEFIDYRTQVL